MGILHEGHSKRKLNKDPNNTKWSRDTNTFGQKILRAQGWQPGQYLGAQDAPHSELHTSANASYIRVILKDDMKGLGFNRAKEDEVTGLGVFQDLLSRLNGKTEAAVEEDRQARWAIKTHKYVEQKYGPMRFVRGGLLVGDELREEPKEEEEKSSEDSTSEAEDVEMDSAPKESKKDKKSKKRKASDADEDNSDRDTETKSKKRRKEERKLKAAGDSTDDTRAKRKEKKSKKEKRSKKAAESSDDEATVDKEKSKKRKSKKNKSQSPEESEDDQAKEAKKAKKEKKDKKDKKKRRREEAETSGSATLVSTPADSKASTGTSTPTLVGTGTSTPQGSRNFVRSRFIAQKRQAVLDTKALAQIFMVKA